MTFKKNAAGSTLFYALLILIISSCAPKIQITNVGEGWAKNSVNTVIFRKNALYTFENTQFCAYYDNDAMLTLAKRTLPNGEWETKTTQYTGNAKDAHNSISIIVDNEGYLHVSWDHHNSRLRYARSVSPLSLALGEEKSMIGTQENVVSYPEFYDLKGGEILFLYRDGGSGNGNLVMNKYNTATQTWTRLQDNLISGENQRNAYWQCYVDSKGTIHISWVWRESPNVASNHDMAYAKSTDGGLTWTKTNGEVYTLPITAASAEYACRIPKNSELINQTSMTADESGNPYIVSYWTPEGSDIPQYHVVYFVQNDWATKNLNFRTLPFSLSGVGTKSIPISRPQMIVSGDKIHVIFRDAERSNHVSIASGSTRNDNWEINDIYQESLSAWEPTLDPSAWQKDKKLYLFIQNTTQIDGEGLSDSAPTLVKVLEYNPN